MGMAAAAPVAAALSLPLPAAVGCLWLGLAGGALPDYLDFQSGMRRALRHRGISHALLTVGLAGALVRAILDALASAGSPLLPLSHASVAPLSFAMMLGLLSHLAGDACTRAGIQPLLPFSRVRVWLLPRWLRGRSDGWLNGVAGTGATLVLLVAVALYVVMLTD